MEAVFTNSVSSAMKEGFTLVANAVKGKIISTQEDVKIHLNPILTDRLKKVDGLVIIKGQWITQKLFIAESFDAID